MSTMAPDGMATVTIDRHYFETLLRSHGGANGAPADSQVSPSEIVLLRNAARKYENLRRNLIRGGVEDATIDLLSRDDSEIQGNKNHLATDDESRVTPTTYQSPHASQVKPRPPPGLPIRNGNSYKNGGAATYNYGGYQNQADKAAWADEEPDADGYDYDEETTVDVPIGDNNLSPQRSRDGQYELKCQRTVLLTNLADGTTHADITDAVRGGMILDIFLRPHDHCVSISFLHSADARAFFDHVRKQDLYIRNKRVGIKWNERQFTLAGHAIGKISGGATRNLVIKGINRARHTEETIREDLDHIHNLIVIKVEFIGGDCHIRTNSLNYALFARTCMMSRGKYRRTKITYGGDECAEPYPHVEPARLQVPTAHQQRREGPPLGKGSNLSNRFQLLHMDGGEDSEVDDPEDGRVAAGFRPKNGVGILA
ncbi:hypothetical protein GE09DRAFT_1117267 [Coniochaeta sp. 2T2.1]|nr:hypothetical protein GE09DRAFT_1117267 [Coniochaeta sp. 2T2.1]